MPQYNELWNPFPHFTPKLQRRITWLAALGSLLVLAATIGILTLVDSSQTYCPGWIIHPAHESGGNSLWGFVWLFSVPVTVLWCWRALSKTERKLLAEVKAIYQKGPPYDPEDPWMQPEGFRTLNHDFGLCFATLLSMGICAIPFFFMIQNCSAWGR